MRRFEWNCQWFQNVWNTYEDERFKTCFRISRETFNFILNRIGHHLTHDTTAEEPISPQERLGICLYRLEVIIITQLQKWEGVDWQLYSTLLKKFVIWLSGTFGVNLLIFVKQFCKWRINDNSPVHLVVRMAAIFHWNFLVAEMKREGSSIILKIFYSIFMMSIVGADYKFLWTSVELSDSSNNACTSQASRLYQNIVGNDFLPEIQKVVKLPNGNELQLPPILLKDSAFPHHVWLQKTFENTTLSRKQSHFNYCFSRARMVAE